MKKFKSIFKNDKWIHSTLAVINRDSFTNGLRALLALSLVLFIHWVANWQSDILQIMLGVIASALTETDDHWRARLRSQIFALCTFIVVSGAVWLTIPCSALLATAICIAAFILTILGAIGDRYRAIAFGSLVLMLYTALSAHSSRNLVASSIPLLLCGAIWYGVISVLWAAIFPKQPVQAKLAKLYSTLGTYLKLKADLLEPIREIDQIERRMSLVLQNARVVNNLNLTKESILSRLKRDSSSKWIKLALHQYLVAQDIHERTSSSHEDYQVLTQSFFHSDVLYRCQRTLRILGTQASTLSEAIQSGSTLYHQGVTKRSIEDLSASIENIEKVSHPNRPLQALHAVRDNLTSMAKVFSEISHPPEKESYQEILDQQSTRFYETWSGLQRELTFRSPLFRHALRLSACLVTGFVIMQAMHDQLGYWILLTIVFVSQQQYAATHQRLVERTIGTTQGLAIGWAITQLFQTVIIQSGIIALLGGVFIGTRRTRYIMATTAITTLLVLSFDQIGLRQVLFPARLWDTLIGCAVAGIAAWLVLPNWQWRLWPTLAARSLKSQANYLNQIIQQYQRIKVEHLPYRLSRREAHNSDAALSNSYAAMQKEPSKVRRNEVAYGRFLVASHTLLNYISALGAHRIEYHQKKIAPEILQLAKQLRDTLVDIANAVEGESGIELKSELHLIAARKYDTSEITSSNYKNTDVEPFLINQIRLCFAVLPELIVQILQIDLYKKL